VLSTLQDPARARVAPDIISLLINAVTAEVRSLLRDQLVHRIAAFRVDAVLLPRRRHVFEWSDRCVGCCASIRMHWTRPQTILARYYSNLAFRINAKSCAPLQIGFPLVLTIREGEAPAEPNCCLAVGSLGSAAASPIWEGEAPAEPNCCLAVGSRGSAAASPLREGEAPAEPNC